MIVYMSNVHAVIYIAWHCQHFYLHYTAVFRNRSVIIPNDFMLSIVCFWFSFLMGWLRARQRIRTALGSSRNTFGSSLCSSKNSDCCMNAVWKWPLTWRRDQLRLEKTFADPPPKKRKTNKHFFNYYYITTVELCSFFMSDLIMRKKKAILIVIYLGCVFSLCRTLERSWFLSEWSPAVLLSSRKETRS